MRRSYLIPIVLSLAVIAVADVQTSGTPHTSVHAEFSWAERGRQLTQTVVSQVQVGWSKMKGWLGQENSSTQQNKVGQTGTGSAGGGTQTPSRTPATPSQPSAVTIVDDPVQARMPESHPSQPVTQTAPAADVKNPEVEARKEQLAQIQTTKGTSPDELRTMKATTQSKKGFAVVDAGRKANPQLQKDKAGVVRSTALAKDSQGRPVPTPKEIPRLDIGQEPRLAAEQFQLNKVQFGEVTKQKFKKLDSPTLISSEGTTQALQKIVGTKGIQPAGAARKLKEVETIQNKILSIAKLQGMKFKIGALRDVQEKPYKGLTPNEVRILAALVLVERGDQCHVASGLLFELRNDKDLEAEANYHLAVCAHKMGLTSQYVSSLLKVIATEDKDFLPKMLEELTVELPYEHEVKVGLALQKIQNKKLIPAKARAKVDYLIAKGNVKAGNFQTAVTAAQAVPKDFAKYKEAQYILATSQYATGQAKAAIQTQEHLLEQMEAAGDSSELKVLLQLNLGRIAFQDKQFEKAKEYFLKIDKNHPLWIEALMEQGWAQLQSGDQSGAIGNMYSVHSPFFRNVFVPESYVIRTIGYINLCQYGDAYKSLSMLEHNYRPWLTSVDKYSTDHPNGKDVYETVRKYLKAPSSSDVDGLPHQVIREIARQRDFLNHQQALNSQEDELAQYKFLEGMLVKEKIVVTQKLSQLNARMQSLQKKWADSKNAHEPKDVQDRWASQIKETKNDVDFYRFRLDIHLDSRKSFGTMRELNSVALAETKSQLRGKASQILARHLADVRRSLTQMMENNELLRYEVFSGSGENIRYQAAGGEVGRVPAAVKPASKSLQWEFDGEYWADEIGNYRSTLANNCPESRGGKTPKVAGGE